MNEKNQALEDIKLIKDMMDRTRKAIDPSAPIFILWGILVVLGNTATHFLAKNVEYHSYIGIMWAVIVFFGMTCSAYIGYKIGRRSHTVGMDYRAGNRIGLIWSILVPVGFAWSFLGPYYDIFKPEFTSVLWAILYSIGIYIMGIFYSKEFIIGGIVIFIGSILSVIFYDYHNLIIAAFMGGGTLYPSIIAQKRVMLHLKENYYG